MQINITKSKNIEVVFLCTNDPLLQLAQINDIPFTNRQIDIIACILNGRTTKKIAELLSVAPKTVETHIRHIMMKLDCNSQEGVIDFINKTDKYSLLARHYTNLLVKNCFELELKKIRGACGEQNGSCILVYDEAHGSNSIFCNQLSEHLLLVRIATIILNKNKDEQFKSPRNKIIQSNASLIISCIFTNQPLNSESVCVDLSEQANYYFFIFELLKQLLPNANINQNIVNFKHQYDSFLAHRSRSGSERDKSSLQEKTKLSQFFSKKTKYLILTATIFSFLVAGIFTLNNYKNSNLSPKQQNTKAPSTITTIHMPLQIEQGETVIWNVPRQDHKFIGREKLLQELEGKLHRQSKTKDSSQKTFAVSVCAGLGGVGKTQLALQYIRHAKHHYTIKAWFEAENLDQLKQQYIEFAGELGYRDREPSFERALFYAKEWLTKHPGWLLVYDNVNSYDEIKDFLPNNGGSIIVTTRQQNWPNTFEKLDINVMAEREAMELVQSLIQHKINIPEQEALKELVKTLGYLPLALAQAGAYIKQSSIPIADYVKLYKAHEQELLIENNLPEGTNSLPIAVIWNISLEAIVKDAKAKNQPPLALHLLSACAYLAPEKISHDLLLTWLKQSYPKLQNPKLLLPKLIGQLGQYSMLSKDEDGNITIHRLVQAVVRHQHHQTHRKNKIYRLVKTMSNYFPVKAKSILNIHLDYAPLTVEWFNILLGSIHSVFCKEGGRPEGYKIQSDLLSHLQSLSLHYDQIWPNTLGCGLIDISNDIGTIFFMTGDLKISKNYYERALLILKNHYGKNDLRTTDTLINLGKVNRDLGDARKAKILCGNAISILEKYYSKDDFKMASPLDCLGNAYKDLGNTTQAKDLHERSLKIKEKYYGKEHFEVAYTLDFLGRDYRDLGDIKQAKDLHEHSLKIKEQYYGKEHFELAYTLDFLGRAYRQLGDAKRAKDLHEHALKIKEQYYGKEHFEVALTLDALGKVYKNLGNYKLAKDLHERALKIQEKYYGQNHVKLTYTLDPLGMDYNGLGDIKQAKELHERSLKIKEQYYGKEHFEVAYTLDFLGKDYRDLGDIKQAKDLHERALKIKEQYYGKEHFEVAYTLDFLGKDYRDLGDIKQAKDLHERALKIKEQYYSHENFETAFTSRLSYQVCK